VNGTTFYPYIAPFALVNDRGTDNPVDDVYWFNDKTDNNGNGTVDEWGEIDPTWTANIWLTTPGSVPSTPSWTTSRKYFYYPTIMELISFPGSDVVKYSSSAVEAFTISMRYKRFSNGKIVFIDGDGEFEQPASYDQEGSPVVIIESTGQWADVQRKVQVEAYPAIRAIFDVAMCGCTNVDIGATSMVIDSYNSSAGLYPAGLGQKGDIGSNGYILLNGGPTISGGLEAGSWIDAANSDVYGDARSGDDIVNGNLWAGEYEEFVSPIPRPCPCDELKMAIDMDYYELNNDNASIGLTDDGKDPFQGTPYHLDLTGGDNLTLYAGTYYFDSIKFGSHDTLTTVGRVYIFLRGSSDITGGGIVNTSQNPTNLIIFSTAEILDVGGNAEFYGALFAPWADIKPHGTSDFYGSMLGNTVTNGSGFHYDEALGIIGTKYFSSLKKISWREIQ
jgi:hypothetical protein